MSRDCSVTEMLMVWLVSFCLFDSPLELVLQAKSNFKLIACTSCIEVHCMRRYLGASI